MGTTLNVIRTLQACLQKTIPQNWFKKNPHIDDCALHQICLQVQQLTFWATYVYPNFILFLTTASIDVHPSVSTSILFFEVFNQHDLDFCMYMGHVHSSQGLKIWKSRTGQGLGLGKRGQCDLDWRSLFGM